VFKKQNVLRQKELYINVYVIHLPRENIHIKYILCVRERKREMRLNNIAKKSTWHRQKVKMTMLYRQKYVIKCCQNEAVPELNIFLLIQILAEARLNQDSSADSVMSDCLISNRDDFVSVMIQAGFSIKTFLAPATLRDLYNRAVTRL